MHDGIKWRGNGLGIVWLLGVTQIIGYGTLYYSFAIIAEDIAGSLSVSRAYVFAGFSLSLVAGGMASPLAGRLTDRHGARAIMWPSSLLAAGALAVASFSGSIWLFTAAFIAISVAGTAVLYDGAFVALAQATGAAAQLRIVQLTLIAGFASTVFWPLTSYLQGAVGWRGVLLTCAALNVLVCAPLHALLPKPPQTEPSSDDQQTPEPLVHQPLPAHLQPRAFALATAGFTLSGFTLSAMLAQLVPVLHTLGFGSASLLVGLLFGPAQVVVRFTNLVFGHSQHPVTVTVLAALLRPLALLCLMFSGTSLSGGVAFAILLGFFSGLKSVVNGTLPLALFGRSGFGQRLGMMALFRVIPGAAAPFVFAWLLDHAGSSAALWFIMACAVAGVLAFLKLARICRRDPASM